MTEAAEMPTRIVARIGLELLRTKPTAELPRERRTDVGLLMMYPWDEDFRELWIWTVEERER